MTSILSIRDPDQGRLRWLASVLFAAYLCVAIPLPVIPVFVTDKLGLNAGCAGLAIGIAFLSTILTRGYAGTLSDRHGAKPAVIRGFAFYAVGALMAVCAGLLVTNPSLAFGILILGRLLLGVGESLVGVGVIAWGVGIVGPANAGKVLALVGMAIYGAIAVGGPLGLFLLDRFGFSVTMAICALLPCLGLLAILNTTGLAPHPHADRPPLWRVIGKVWPLGLIVFLQGIGFAAIGAFFVLYFQHQSWSHAGLGFTAFGSGFVLVRILLGHLPDRVGGLRVAIGSLAIEAVGQYLIWYAQDPLMALAGAFLTGLGCSLVFPAMGREVVRLVEPHLRGVAVGGYAAFQDLAYGLTGPLAGLLAEKAGLGSVFCIGGVAASMGFLLAIFLLRASTRASAY